MTTTTYKIGKRFVDWLVYFGLILAGGVLFVITVVGVPMFIAHQLGTEPAEIVPILWLWWFVLFAAGIAAYLSANKE